MVNISSQQEMANLKKVWSAFKEPNSNIDNFVFDKEQNPLIIQKRIIDFVERIGGSESKIDACDIQYFVPKLIDLFQNTLKCSHFMRDMQCFRGRETFKIDLMALSAGSCYLIEIENRSNYAVTNRLNKKLNLVNKHLPEFSELKKKGVVFSIHYSEEFKYNVLAAGFYFVTADEFGYELHLPE